MSTAKSLIEPLEGQTEETTFSLPDAEDKMPYADSISTDKDQVLRLEETVSRRWSGVASCGHTDRIQTEARTALNEWVREKMFQYRHLRYLRAGSGEGRARWTDYNPPFGARSCNGSLTMPCYIEFYQP